MGRVRDWGSATIELADLTIGPREVCRTPESRPGGGHLRSGDRRPCGRVLGTEQGRRHPFDLGELTQAEQELRAGIDGLLATQPADAVMASGWLALCLLRQGRSDEARTILDEHAGLISKFEVRGYFLRPVCVARAALSLGTAEHAQGTVRQAALSEARTAWRSLQQGREGRHLRRGACPASAGHLVVAARSPRQSAVTVEEEPGGGRQARRSL